jgi:AraC family transcriptional regulator of adaptative response/methylated-DNA-[protein]-cysteine methyltransferase
MNRPVLRDGSYEIVAQAIRFIRAQAQDQPSLGEVADHVGLSPSHLQRVFSAWAGISPKRFLQYLTKEHARLLLRQSRDVLTAAYEAGLSGPGRLHDLLVVCDAVTPGEVRGGGEGLKISFGFGPSPFGPMLLATTPRGICHLHFVEPGGEETALAALQAEWPRARLVADGPAAVETVRSIFGRTGPEKPLSLLLRGTNFQIKVWEALVRVAPGEVVSYHGLAALAGAPQAQRAVGSALAANRIAVLIPCHRVIRENGEVGQYRWGGERKSALLAWECARRGQPAGADGN